MLSFSVIVNTYNRATSLPNTLAGLAALDYPQFEIVAVNGPSNDGTEEVLANYSGHIKVARLAERNLSMSRNLGIAAAAGDIVAFIDDDAFPDPAWLDRLAEGYDRDEVAAVGGPTYDRSGYTLQAHYLITDRLGATSIQGPENRNPAELLCRPYAACYPTLLGTNSSFRRSVLLELGGFDEEFEYYLDETDLCIRLVDSGYVVRPVDDGYVYHKFLASHRRTEKPVLHDRYALLKNQVYFGMKHAAVYFPEEEIHRSLMSFVQSHRKAYRRHVERGDLTNEDLRQFEIDVERAFVVGKARARAKAERTRPVAWFREREKPFLPFPSRRPARQLHIAFVVEDNPKSHAGAAAMARRGHHVHVLTNSRRGNTVDFEDGVWVRRVASWQDEAVRVHRHRPLDLLQGPMRPTGEAGTIPFVYDADAADAVEQFYLSLARTAHARATGAACS